MESKSQVLAALDAAVELLGGQHRQGQEEMASAVSNSLNQGTHLLVQAGTGTGKSLGYLIPAIIWSLDSGKRVVVATATLALQSQLANKDIPIALKAIKKVTGESADISMLKGRSNYACLLRCKEQVGLDQQSELPGEDNAFNPQSETGRQVIELRNWADEELENDGAGDRDSAPSHNPKAWQQVSVSARECIGAQQCAYSAQCFAEKAREQAAKCDVLITNHALLAIDAMNENNTLPEYDAVVIDEAHELTNRVTSAASTELSSAAITRTVRRASGWLADDLVVEALDLADDFDDALADCQPGQITDEQSPAILVTARVQDVMRKIVSALGKSSGEPDPERTQAANIARETFETAERIASLSEHDVVWIAKTERSGNQLHIAPLSVSGLMRERILSEATTIVTSATLAVGGNFKSAAASIGLKSKDQFEKDEEPGSYSLAWQGIDVGSPFDYQKQGIFYIARHLPRRTKSGIDDKALAEIVDLLKASKGSALGLFSSQKAAEQAAEYVRKKLPKQTIYCQGEAQLSDLTTKFTEDINSSLFGTLSLWQGIDVPGDTCRLVIIDKIPFPRPDDPLMQARQRAVDQSGGNGFMQVAASHAGLLLAQGAGRLIRTSSDRGVVAVLDSRLATQKYGSFLQASIPKFWKTEDHDVVIGALERLAAAAEKTERLI